MRWLTEIRRFLNEEKIYGYLLALIVMFYALFLFAAPKAEELPESPAMAKLKAAEKQIKEKQSDREFLEETLSKDPVAAVFLFGFGLFIVCGVAGGVVIDAVAVSKITAKQSPIPPGHPMEPSRWGLGDVVKVLILFFVCGFLMSFVIGLTQRIMGAENFDENWAILAHTTLNDLIILFMIIYFVVKKHGGSLADIGLHFRQKGKDLMIGLAGYLGTLPLFMLVLALLIFVASLFSYEPPPHPLVEVFVEEDKKNPWLIGYSLFLACVLGPVIEEVFFRGFCYPALKKLWGVRVGMIITAGVFAWIHHSTFAFWPIFVLGLILVYLFEKRGSLIPSITMHVVHNSVFIGYFFLMKRVFLDKLL